MFHLLVTCGRMRPVFGRKKKTIGDRLGRQLNSTALISGLVLGMAMGSQTTLADATPEEIGQGIANYASLFPRTADYDFEPPVPGSYKLHPLKAAPDGTVLDHTSKAGRLSDILNEKISLVSFVYLLCSDEQGCPLAMATLFDIHEGSGEAAGLKDHVQLVTISFDPARDTPEALDAFAYPTLHGADADRKLDWQFLTTRDETELEPIIEGFGQAVDRSGDNDVINHLLRMFLVDREGQIRNVYGLGMLDPRLLMTDIETLLIEEAGM